MRNKNISRNNVPPVVSSRKEGQRTRFSKQRRDIKRIPKVLFAIFYTEIREAFSCPILKRTTVDLALCVFSVRATSNFQKSFILNFLYNELRFKLHFYQLYWSLLRKNGCRKQSSQCIACEFIHTRTYPNVRCSSVELILNCYLKRLPPKFRYEILCNASLHIFEF